MVNDCSRTMTTFTSCPHVTESVQSTPSSNLSCSHMLGSACMGARRKSGTWLGSDQKPVMCWSRLPNQPTPQLSCGGGPRFRVCNKGSRSWGHIGPPGFCFPISSACCSVGADSVGAGAVSMASVGPLCSSSGNSLAEGTATVALGRVRQIS